MTSYTKSHTKSYFLDIFFKSHTFHIFPYVSTQQNCTGTIEEKKIDVDRPVTHEIVRKLCFIQLKTPIVHVHEEQSLFFMDTKYLSFGCKDFLQFNGHRTSQVETLLVHSTSRFHLNTFQYFFRLNSMIEVSFAFRGYSILLYSIVEIC